MAENKKNSNEMAYDSANGISRLNPVNKSFNGVSSLRPQEQSNSKPVPTQSQSTKTPKADKK